MSCSPTTCPKGNSIGDPNGLELFGLCDFAIPEVVDALNENFIRIAAAINGDGPNSPLNVEIPDIAFVDTGNPTQAEALVWIGANAQPTGSVVVYAGSGTNADPVIMYWIGPDYPVDLKGVTVAAP